MFLIDAKNDKEARALGAMANIAEGRGTALDAAKFFRESGMGPDKLAAEGISLKGSIADDGVALSHLSDRLFREVATGKLRHNRALHIARELGDAPDLQDQLATELQKLDDKGRDVPDGVVFEMARAMADSKRVRQTTKSLFGDEESERSTFFERATIQAAVRKELSERATAFRAVSSEERAERLGEAGNVIQTEENQKRAHAAKTRVWSFNKMANLKGDLSNAFNELAGQLADDPRSKKRLVAEAVRRTEALLPSDAGSTEAVGAGTEAYSRVRAAVGHRCDRPQGSLAAQFQAAFDNAGSGLVERFSKAFAEHYKHKPAAGQSSMFDESKVMRWGSPGADAICHLRALFLSEPTQWDAFWQRQ